MDPKPKTRDEWRTQCMAIYGQATEYLDLLRAIVDDGTGSIGKPDKRLWPIRMANYRQARVFIKQAEGGDA